MKFILQCLLSGWLVLGVAHAEQDPFVFDDQPLEEPLPFPAWFKLSFLDLREDLAESTGNKRDLVIYFGQKHCPYCEALLHTNFGKTDIQKYTCDNFDVVGLDIHGARELVDFSGNSLSESEFAEAMDVNFTPTLAFFRSDEDGNPVEVFRLRGYYPPYKFRAALEYVADDHYRQESFRDFLGRADVPLVFEEGDLNYQPFFMAPPFALDRTRIPGERPLMVFFEQPDCYACDVLHTGPLQKPEIRERIGQLEAVQLNMWADTPVITPGGRRTTARAWAENLGLFYTPTLIFYDRQGREIIRVDSVIQFYRLRNVLDYVLSGAYRDYPNFQRWREAQRR